MENMQTQMNAILQNPDMMEKIMSMAQSLGQSSPEQQPSVPDTSGFSMPDIDFATVQKLSGFLGQSNIDKNQRTLLNALSAYLSNERIAKLEKAMRAAKLATLASTLLALAGQTETQRIQLMHLSLFTARRFSASMAPTGQSWAHRPQPVQRSPPSGLKAPPGKGL